MTEIKQQQLFQRNLDALELNDAKLHIKELKRQLKHHNYLYYVQDSPEISDTEYDNLYQKLIKLESVFPELITQDSPTQRVGAKVDSRLPTVKHSSPMYSLENAFSEKDLKAWNTRVNNQLESLEDSIEYVTEFKIDGLAISLIYKEGHLVRAATRGDGFKGEDITANVRTIRSIPTSLEHSLCPVPPEIEVRGEIFMPFTSFLELNNSQKKAGNKLFANPRNAAAGSVRQLDPKVTSSRNLDAFFYTVTVIKGETSFLSHWESLNYLKLWRFKTNPENQLCRSMTEVINYINRKERRRETLRYATDGIVIKLNNLNYQKQLGYTSKGPRWAIAWKYPPEIKETIIEDITLSVGRTGIITPIALMKPTPISGTIVERASLHNFNELERKDIRINDTVRLQKAAEIIPEVLSYVPENRLKHSQRFERPLRCPSCGEKVIQLGEEVAIRCGNTTGCPAQIQNRLEHWASKNALDMDGIGPSVIEKLLDSIKIKSPVDLFKLTEDDFFELEGFKKKSAENAYQAIQQAKDRPLWSWIHAFGIRHVGKETAQLLTKYFPNIGALSKATIDDLTAIDGIGPQMAESIEAFFKLPENNLMISELQDLGIRLEEDHDPLVEKPQVFEGQTFVLTGTLPTMTRSDAETEIKSRGGKVSGSVSKKTSYILAGESPGRKLQKGEDLGVTILDESGFIELITP